MTAIANLPDIRPSLLLDFANSGRVDPRIQCLRASDATCYGQNGVMRTVGANVPRIDFDPATGKCLGLLTEERRVNLLTYSEDFGNSAWTKLVASILPNVTAAPNGTLTAEKFIPASGSSSTNSLLSQIVDVSVNTSYSFSFFAKAAEISQLRSSLITRPGTTGYIGEVGYIFDLTAGTAVLSGVGGTPPTSPSASITPAGNGWYRCTITATTTGTAEYVSASIRNQLAGDGTSGIYLWGAQLEQGAFPTSYIPTEASAVTRAADVPVVPEQQLSAFGTLLAKYSKSGWKHPSTPVSGSLNLSKHIGNSTQVNETIERLALYPRQLTAAQIARLEAA